VPTFAEYVPVVSAAGSAGTAGLRLVLVRTRLPPEARQSVVPIDPLHRAVQRIYR
jgi:hypothetical protein